MAIRLADTAVPMNDNGYPVARAKHIWLDNDISLQKAIDDGLISGDDSTILTEQEYNELPEEDKIKGTFYLYDTGKIFKNSVQYGVTEPIELTYQEYSEMKEQGLIDPDQEYIVSADAEGILLEASDIGYSNAVSNLPCTTVQGAIDKVAEKVDGLISDTSSSTTNTYSSAKIDEKYGAYTFGTADTTQWLKLTLGNSSKFQPIIITDQYGGKVEITGMADDGTYKSVKFIRYSYGDWNIYSATDYTFTSQNDANYKIRRLYYYPTNGCYYLEIRQWCTIKVSGTTTKPEMVTSLPAEASAMTSIPESNWGKIDDTSTNTTSTWSSSKIASSMQWKLLGSLTTSGDLSDAIPDTANEICVIRRNGATIKDFSFILPIVAITNFGTGITYVDNFVTGATYGIQIEANKQVKLNSTLESGRLEIYYR